MDWYTAVIHLVTAADGVDGVGAFSDSGEAGAREAALACDRRVHEVRNQPASQTTFLLLTWYIVHLSLSPLCVARP